MLFRSPRLLEVSDLRNDQWRSRGLGTWPASRPHPDLYLSAHSSGTPRVPPASPSSHSLAPPSGERSRLARGSTIRSTFHGGQVRDRRAGGGAGGGVQNGPPASPTLAHEATPLPPGRPRPTTNLFTKLTSKLTRR